MTKEEIKFEKIKVLEWYDGLVRGIAVGEEKSYLLILGAWADETGEKVYVVVDLDEDSKTRITNVFTDTESKETDWQSFETVFNELIASYSGIVRLIRGEIGTNKIHKARYVEGRYLNKLIPYDVQDAFRDKTLWLD